MFLQNPTDQLPPTKVKRVPVQIPPFGSKLRVKDHCKNDEVKEVSMRRMENDEMVFGSILDIHFR